MYPSQTRLGSENVLLMGALPVLCSSQRVDKRGKIGRRGGGRGRSGLGALSPDVCSYLSLGAGGRVYALVGQVSKGADM